MDDNYFDKKIKNILNAPPEFGLDPMSMMDMEKRLIPFNTKEKNRQQTLAWWLLLFLPLFAGGFYFFTSYQNLNNQVQLLTEHINNIQQDTLKHQYITYRYDTIYTTIYKEKIIERTVVKKTEKENFSQKYVGIKNTYFNLNPNSRNSLISHWSLGLNGPVLLNRGPNSSFFNPNKKEKNIPKETASVSFKGERIPLLNLDLLQTKEKSKFKNPNNIPDAETALGDNQINPLFYFTPIGFNAGINYAPFISSNIDGYQKGTTIGINGEIEFVENVNLTIGIERLNKQAEVKDQQATSSIYPIILPADPTDILHEVKANLSYLQIPVGIKKSFFNKNKTRPFISFGLVAIRPYQQKFIYEYINSLGEYKTPFNLSDGEFKVNSWRAGLGVQRTLLKDINAHIGMYYQKRNNIEKGEYFPLKYIGLDVGLKHGF